MVIREGRNGLECKANVDGDHYKPLPRGMLKINPDSDRPTKRKDQVSN